MINDETNMMDDALRLFPPQHQPKSLRRLVPINALTQTGELLDKALSRNGAFPVSASAALAEVPVQNPIGRGPKSDMSVFSTFCSTKEISG